jgi:hypothetical protein
MILENELRMSLFAGMMTVEHTPLMAHPAVRVTYMLKSLELRMSIGMRPVRDSMACLCHTLALTVSGNRPTLRDCRGMVHAAERA